jgi:alpha-beta hydrolase superfamily lysophospholipase
MGRSCTTVILAAEYPANQCSWLDYPRVLERAGLTVLLFDFRGLGEPRRRGQAGAANGYQWDVAAAVEEARRRGGRMILLAGASLGGTAAMVAAPSVSPPLAAAVSLSSEADLESFFPGAGLDGRLGRPSGCKRRF